MNVYSDMRYATYLCEEMLKDIDRIIEDYELSTEKLEFLSYSKKQIKEIYEKYEDNIYDINKEISNELLSKENVEYMHKYNCYPEDASKTYKQVIEDFESVFELEDKIHDDIVVPIWENYISTSDSSFNQGDDFFYVVHSGEGFINLPGSPHYIEDKLNNNEYISCSLHTPKIMDMYNECVGIVLKVNKDSLVVSSKIDCETREREGANIFCVKVNSTGSTISAGYLDSVILKREGNKGIVTKLLTPKEIERYCVDKSIKQNGEILNNSNSTTINEVVIDKEYAEIDMIYLQTNGCDFLLSHYIYAKQMEEFYGKKLRVINKSVYRKNAGLAPYTKEDYQNFNYFMNYYSKPANLEFLQENPKMYNEMLNGYINEVIEPNGFESEIKERLLKTINMMKEYTEVFINQDNTNIKNDSLKVRETNK